ncbi:MAG: hypothetical protein Q9169_004813 [Polycauliona sp. 2 TL-2023]
MHFSSLFHPFFLLLLLVTQITANPTPEPQSLSPPPTLPPPPPHQPPTKRVPTTHLPGGWTFHLSTPLTTLTPLPPAATALTAFYTFCLSSLFPSSDDPPITSISTRVLSLSDETFELLFRIHDRYAYPDARVSIFLVQQFVTLMALRTRRGMVGEFRGWLKGPGGVVVDVVLSVIPARSLLDSAMDFFGDP